MIPRKCLCLFVYICIKIIRSAKCDDGISLAFAIDDSRSMFEVIEQVKAETNAVLKTELSVRSRTVKDYVLVTINDPKVKLCVLTQQSSVFRQELNGTKLHNYENRDPDEMVLTGIETTLRYSRPESHIFIFTDAAAKDLDDLEEIKSLCRRKQSQVAIILLTKYYDMSIQPKFTVYYDVAKVCFGQVYHIVKEEIHLISQITNLTSLEKHSLFYWKMMNKTDLYVPVTFTLFDKAEYAFVSASGKNVNFKVTTIDNLRGPNPDFEKTVWHNDTKIIKLVNPKPATYFAWMKAESIISFAVYGRTDFTFEYNFTALTPKYKTNKQPISDLKHHMYINVTNRDNAIQIMSAIFVDSKNDTIINKLALKNIGENKYISEVFISPKNVFKIKIEGRVKKTNETITKISGEIDPLIVDLIPESFPIIKIVEGTKIDVNYGSSINLTCTVTAHPKPNIDWVTSNGTLLPSRSSTKSSEENLFVSHLKLDDVKQNESYFCKASNERGQGKNGVIKINVRPIFTKTHVKGIVDAEYGEDIKIPCNIRSYLPVKIRWMRAGREIGDHPDVDISPDGSVLTIKAFTVKMQGRYTCEMILASDPTKKENNDFDIKIPGLARPEILTTNHNINITKGEKIKLHCPIIRGYPKPQFKWFKKNGNNSTLLENYNSEVLIVKKALFSHAGQYECNAINDVGFDNRTFVVNVRYSPEITISGTTGFIPFDGNANFTCTVESYPAPIIQWKDEKGLILSSEIIKNSANKFNSRLNLNNLRKSNFYTCLASNNIGATDDYVKVTVAPPFVVRTQMQDKIGVNYGTEETTLKCDITSAKPMIIRWYKQKAGVKSSRLLIMSSNKYVVSDDGTKMTIKSMDMNAVGKYTCEASLLDIPTEKLTHNILVSIVDLLKPEIIYSTETSINKSFTAICRFKGVPKPTISWQFKARNTEEFKSLSESKEEMNIPELRLQHSGVYKCIGQNFLGTTEQNFNKTVEEQPIITNDEPSLYGIEGDSIMKIPCNVTGFPVPLVRWKKGGKNLKMGSRYEIKGFTLYIKKPVQSDSDEYVCEAENKLGKARETYYVNILVDNLDDILNGESYDIHLEMEKPSSIKCNLDHVIGAPVRWYKEGILTKQTGSTYELEKTTRSDEGNYTCRVNTDEGSKSETYVVAVGIPPYFLEDSVSPIVIDWKYNPQILDCAADAEPTPKFKWTHNGKTDVEHNMKDAITVDDWGQYKCQVSNIFGTISKTFEVKSAGCFIPESMGTPNQPLLSDVTTTTWTHSLSTHDILLDKNDKIKFSCPNGSKSSNMFKMIPKRQEVVAYCKGQNEFIIDGQVYKYTDLQCHNKVEPFMEHTGKQCYGLNSEIIRVGFKVNDFLEAYRVCFETKLRVPLYASAAAIDLRNYHMFHVDTSKFEWNPTPEFVSSKSVIWEPEKNCTCCYTKQQLVNVNEMPFGPAQVASFADNLNSILVWNPIGCDDDSSRMPWSSFDNTISTLDSHSLSWTGASNYEEKEIGYVPRYIWKVTKTKEYISVLVYVNDQYPLETDMRCSTECSIFAETDSFLYCCTLEEFTKKFNVPLKIFIDT